jgi:hypothetical protein
LMFPLPTFFVQTQWPPPISIRFEPPTCTVFEEGSRLALSAASNGLRVYAAAATAAAYEMKFLRFTK